ncbi:hypothetical protein CVT26_014345 [Gymnopilus dilepis]|uniref:Uncharacterized protein n=1 Tax=Gymnopilus dilepis TaxID=231916 RepID=A0A409Y6U3_9AGAR|nr:hypothetical protein CVT26_014345 [Gymnopilus dilepis]
MIKELLLKPKPNVPVKSTSLKQVSEPKEPPKTSKLKELKKVTFDPKADSAKKNESKPASLPKPKVKKSKKLETGFVDSGTEIISREQFEPLIDFNFPRRRIATMSSILSLVQ